jgi:hypothetical protein
MFIPSGAEVVVEIRQLIALLAPPVALQYTAALAVAVVHPI